MVMLKYLMNSKFKLFYQKEIMIHFLNKYHIFKHCFLLISEFFMLQLLITKHNYLKKHILKLELL